MMTTTPALSVRGLWKVYGPSPEKLVNSADSELTRSQLQAKSGNVVAMRNVSFEVAPGEVFVVMGLSGSGKSTLLRSLIRLIEPTSGNITISGIDVSGASKSELVELRRHKVAMVFQHFGLLPHRSLTDNVAFGLEVRGDEKSARRAKAEELLQLVGLGGLGASKPDQLSGGMQQRVGLARALATNPDVLLFDEPFSALDPLIRRDMQDEVLRLQSDLKKTMVFITHDLSEALRLGNRIAIMRDGAFVQVGTPAEIVTSPADDYVRDFIRDVSKGNVVKVRTVMRPYDGSIVGNQPTVGDNATVQQAAELLAKTRTQLTVLDGSGATVGVVDHLDVLSIIAPSTNPELVTSAGQTR